VHVLFKEEICENKKIVRMIPTKEKCQRQQIGPRNVVLATQNVYCGVDIPLAAFLFADFEASIERESHYNA